MKCPKCGNPRAEFEQQAGYKSTPKKKNWTRTNWSLKKCKNCGHEGQATRIFLDSSFEGAKPIEEKAKEVIKMKYD